MQEIIDRLGIPLTVKCVPNEESKVHGQILSGHLLIYDDKEEDAWDTFTHEIIEFKFKQVTSPYRALINSLIEGYERIVYGQKEQFVQDISFTLAIINEKRKDRNNNSRYKPSKQSAQD
jgi:hypothetical protein